MVINLVAEFIQLKRVVDESVSFTYIATAHGNVMMCKGKVEYDDEIKSRSRSETITTYSDRSSVDVTTDTVAVIVTFFWCYISVALNNCNE